MAMMGKIRRMHFRQGKSVQEIVPLTSLSVNRVRKWSKAPLEGEPRYRDNWWPALLQNAQIAADEGATSLILGGAVFAGLSVPPAPAGTHWIRTVQPCANDVNRVLSRLRSV